MEATTPRQMAQLNPLTLWLSSCFWRSAVASIAFLTVVVAVNSTESTKNLCAWSVFWRFLLESFRKSFSVTEQGIVSIVLV